MSNSMTVGSPELANLFRATSLAKRKQRFLGEVVLAGPASTPFAVAIAGVCLATLITLAFVVQVPARLHAPGVLLPVGGLATVGAEQSGVVGHVLVEAGTTVAAGQPLITLIVDRRLEDGTGSFATRVESTARQRKLLRQRREQERVALGAKLESMRLRQSALQYTLVSLTERLLNTARQVELAQIDHRRLAALALEGHVASRDVEPAELRLLQAEATLNELNSQQMEAQTAIERVTRDMASESASFEAIDLNLAMESETLASQAVELDGLARRAIVAPIDGQVTDVLVRPGDTVSAGAAVVNLHRSNSPIEARLYLSSLVAGRAEPGQEAVLKLPTFPSRQFGVLRGKLIEMTSAPMDPRSVRLVPNLLTPVYEARVELESQHMHAMGRRWSLRPGLSAEATIVETRRTLISWLLQPLIRGSGAPDTNLENQALASVEAGI